MSHLITRPMTPADVPACTNLLNHIIAQGGTTAYETPYSEADLEAHYLGETEICVVVEHEGQVVGFQGSFLDAPGTLSIGSFADQRVRVKGAGRALFAATKLEAKRLGFHTILAKITEDNTPGLTFYSAMGFEDFKIIPDDAMRAGQPIARVIKRFRL